MIQWPGADGFPISCRAKIAVLEENQAELAQVMQDAFEDAVLMGVDEQALRGMIADMATRLQSPKAVK